MCYTKILWDIFNIFSHTWTILTSLWCYQMETFSTLLALCEGNLPVTSEFLSQRPVMWSYEVFLICAWTNGWANHWDAGDLRCHQAHYDITVMSYHSIICLTTGGLDVFLWKINLLRMGDTYMQRLTRSSMDQIFACHLFSSTTLLSEPILDNG